MRDKIGGNLQVGGRFSVGCFDQRGRRVWSEDFTNGIVSAALLAVLDIMFRNSTQLPSWYLAPITLVSSVSAADSMTSHAGWTEINANYDEAARPAWAPPAASGGKLKNTDTVVMTFNATTVADGLMLTSDSVKGATNGTLWCTGLFSSSRTFSSGQELRIFYELTASAV